jgi:hypothetical protein
MKKHAEEKSTPFDHNPALLEKYSSAFTLSDMEIFIFPDLLYALVLANIMSPEIWKWRDDPWFEGIRKMGPLKKVHRVKQYIMDHYNFNLDLDTWGLTDKETEINRFKGFIDMEMLSKSNALFGYEGDKYYFDMDIRKHFGLDKYDSEIIPYWKTETVEAMNAFRFKPTHEAGAGECVSLACLYAAALFIVAEVPLEKIFLLGTPLHSQNFIMIDEGVLTNNRRIVTKAMWFNGTGLSALARRALENEQVTYVAHSSGWIHTTYPDATIDGESYAAFRDKLTAFLETEVDYEVFINFLRDYRHHQSLFQLCFPCRSYNRYIRLEKAFHYEHGSKNRLGDKTAQKLYCEMDEEDLHVQPIDHRFRIFADDDLFQKTTYRLFLNRLTGAWPGIENHPQFLADLKKFVHTVPRLPSGNKTFLRSQSQDKSHESLRLSTAWSREEIVEYVQSMRLNLSPDGDHSGAGYGSLVADLAFYAGRYMDRCHWQPFFKAAFERNPVSIGYFREMDIQTIYQTLHSWTNASIYEGNRLALPDEVMNFQRGDGLEKAITMVHLLKTRNLGEIHLRTKGSVIQVKAGNHSFAFNTAKSLQLSI